MITGVIVTFRNELNGGKYEGKGYAFKSAINDLETGDFVVVDCANGFQVCRVTDVCEEVPTAATAWVVCKLDVQAHEARIKKEQDIKKLKNQINAKRKQVEERAILDLLAEKDEDFKSMLDALDGMENDLEN